jgi:hypothetical protein
MGIDFFLRLSLLQKSLTPPFRRTPDRGPGQAPESRIVLNSWIPGRASLARNDDFLLLPSVLQEPRSIDFLVTPCASLLAPCAL